MINDSIISNNSCTHAIKQQLFSFQVMIPNRNRRKQLIRKQREKPTNEYNPQAQQSEHQAWRPRISSKKLMADPKFAFTVQKRKKRQILGMSQVKVPQNHRQKQYSHSTSKERFDNTTKTKLKSLYKSMFVRENQNVQVLPTYAQPKGKRQKTPHLNFNLHHVLLKRKALSVKQQRQTIIQGSNLPFYNFFASDKFLTGNPTIQSESVKKRAYGSSNSYRDGRTISANSSIKRPSTTIGNYETIRSVKNMQQTITFVNKQL